MISSWCLMSAPLVSGKPLVGCIWNMKLNLISQFSESLGNGYAITAVVRKEVMEAVHYIYKQHILTERIGSAAALKTLEVMEKTQSWRQIKDVGDGIRIRWDSLAKQYGLSVEHWGLASLAGFSIKSENSIAYKTLITQEMLAKGFLASNCVYVCTTYKFDHRPIF